MPRKEIIEIAESLGFKWERGAWRITLSNGCEVEIQLGIFEKFYNAGVKAVKKESIDFLQEKLYKVARQSCETPESAISQSSKINIITEFLGNLRKK